MTIATLLFAFVALPAGGDADASAGTRPIMLDFTASWCGPCQQMRPAVERLVRGGYPVKAVDIDRSPELAERYQVTGVPTFVVVEPGTGRDLGRLSGARPASELVGLYREARARFDESRGQDRNDETPVEAESLTDANANANPEPETDAPAVATPVVDDAEAAESRPSEAPNPKPWETVVRIKVHGQGSIGFGSGTVIASSPKESIILTCAHIFKLERGPQAPPSRFPRRITIDLFDGKLTGTRPSQVHYANETFEGEAIDYDFDKDVGLIRFRPGRRLPHARVVPTYWKPQERFGMITVGCSEGHDASAWNTVITNPTMRAAVSGHKGYEAIECAIAPKQGRSGGGLFTSDGYVAGVCDFAEPQGDRGLYATPRSIYAILDRNKLAGLYAPVTTNPGALLAANPEARPAQGPRVGLASHARGQSPEPERPGDITLPAPELLNIRTPAVAAHAADRSGAGRRGTWQPRPAASTTDLQRDTSTDPDRFDNLAPAPGAPEPTPLADAETETTPPQAPRVTTYPGKWKPVRAAQSSPLD